MKSVVADPGQYDWKGDLPRNRPFAETVIYELHCARLHPSSEFSGVTAETRGTYAGLIDKIAYLKDSGITAVELLPVFQFDPQDAPAGTVELLGLPAGLFFCAASSVQLAARSARSAR
jgi:glycogen operon protein